MLRVLAVPILFASSLLLTQAYERSSFPPAFANLQFITVNAGPANVYVNGPFASATICVPGTSQCQTIDGLLVDTGSSGLRILSSAVSVPLPVQATATGNPVGECAEFLDGFTWGPVATADVRMAGEVAAPLPIQVIGSPGFAAVPAPCANTGGVPENNLATLGANGILGIGLFLQDCGIACTFTGAANPGLYYSCPRASACQQIAEPAAQQVQNPVSLFARDNNGVVIDMPSVSDSGQATATGAMIFGIGTASDNGLGSAKVLVPDLNGTITTVYNGQAFPSFIDSGSNGIYFLSPALAGIPACSDAPDFYCPAAPRTFSATLRDVKSATNTAGFTVGNADVFLRASQFSVFSQLAGPNPGAFDWGLPFFYGRTVFTAIEGRSTPAGQGPYWAY